MALIEEVKSILNSLSSGGWAELFAHHGLNISASNLRQQLLKPLTGIDRTAPVPAGMSTRELESRPFLMSTTSRSGPRSVKMLCVTDWLRSRTTRVLSFSVQMRTFSILGSAETVAESSNSSTKVVSRS